MVRKALFWVGLTAWAAAGGVVLSVLLDTHSAVHGSCGVIKISYPVEG